ncbi:MAG: VWA domain-containing protein, partial [Gammaproteobacteria bacterium]
MAISELHIAWPWVFFLLLPLAAGWWAFSRSPFHVSDEPSLRLSNVEGLNQEDYGKKAISPFFLLALLLVLVALSRPQIQGPDNVSRLSFMLVLDVSGSMQQPYRVKEGIQSKLNWIKRAVQRFLTELSRRPPAFIPEVGIVLFADHAYRMFPPTRDLDHLAAAVKAIETGMIGEKSSLDEAIVLSLGEVRGRSDNATSQGGEGKSGVLVIMTDGLHTSERLRLKQALTSAVKQQVAVFPIVIGSTSVNDSEVGFF